MMGLESIEIVARGLRFPALSCGSGPLVLCLHGFPDTRFSFRHQLRAWADAGYRVVAPALRGYAPGCMPPLRDAHALEAAKDAVAIVGALGESRTHLVGHDWGAVTAYLAAALAPTTFHTLTALAVPHPIGMVESLAQHPRQVALSSYMLFFQLPELADRAVAHRDFALLEQLWKRWSPGYRFPHEDLRELKTAFREPGVVTASLAYYRAMFALFRSANREAQTLLRKPLDVPILALSGLEDGCIDAEVFRRAMDRAPYSSAVVEQFVGLGHFLHLEDPARLNERILRFFRSRGV